MSLSKKGRDLAWYKARHPGKKNYELAEEFGVTPEWISMLQGKPEFQELYKQELQEAWKEYIDECQELMMNLAKKGDYRAVQYILDSGGFKAPEKVELKQEVITIGVDDDED